LSFCRVALLFVPLLHELVTLGSLCSSICTLIDSLRALELVVGRLPVNMQEGNRSLIALLSWQGANNIVVDAMRQQTKCRAEGRLNADL
jgi:hypothetical protein